MTLRLGLVGAGSFLPHFARLFAAHPGVGAVLVADLVRERAEAPVAAQGLAGAAGILSCQSWTGLLPDLPTCQNDRDGRRS